MTKIRHRFINHNTDPKTKIAFVYCDIEDTIYRNKNRETDDVSSYYTQEYHFKWIEEAIH